LDLRDYTEDLSTRFFTCVVTAAAGDQAHVSLTLRYVTIAVQIKFIFKKLTQSQKNWRVIMTSEPRVWEMYGHKTDREVWVAVGSEFFVRIHGYRPPPEPVTVTEDPEGEYMGWIDFEDEEPREPSMIQHHKIFDNPISLQLQGRGGARTR
jgi:hypothetical protein